MYTFDKTMTIAREDYGEEATEEYHKDLESCRDHYDYYIEYKDRTIFFENDKDYTKYLMSHSRDKIKNYGRL